MPQAAPYVDRTPEKLLIAALSILIIVASVISYFFIIGEKMSSSPGSAVTEKMAIARIDGVDILFKQKMEEGLIVNASLLKDRVKFKLEVITALLKDDKDCANNLWELQVDLMAIETADDPKVITVTNEWAQLWGFEHNIIGRLLLLTNTDDNMKKCGVIGIDMKPDS